MSDPRRMTLSDQHPWIFICSIFSYRAFSHASFSSDALLLKSETQAQRKGSSFCPHNIYIETHCHIFIVINTKLVIGRHIWKNIPGLKPTKLHHTYDRKTKVQYGAKNGQKRHQSAPWTPLILIEASNVHYLWPNSLSNISFAIMTLSLLPWTITVFVFSRMYSKLIR